MALDLTLIAIPHYRTIEMLAADQYHEDILHGIHASRFMESELLTAKANNDTALEQELTHILAAVDGLRQTYPGQDPKPYRFDSRYRGYSTLKFLLQKHCKAMGEPVFHFFEGKRLPTISPYSQIHFLANEDVLRINGQLSAITFKQLLVQYDYEEVLNNAYKPKSPDQLHYLEEEYQELVSFFARAAALKAYVIIQLT